jgi:hypothetical protein
MSLCPVTELPMTQALGESRGDARIHGQTVDAQAAPSAIVATLNYIVDDGTKIFTETAAPGATDVRAGGKPDPRQVTIRNGRPYAGDFSLDRHGFRFIDHDTEVGDFFDESEIRGTYYAEMEALVKAQSGAARVVVFDHTLRTADDAEREARQIREVVTRVHNDYTEWSAPQRVRDVLPDEAGDLLGRRFAIIQVWRPIRHPVETFPLAICDARSVAFSDFVISERRYPNRGFGVQGLRFTARRPRPLDRPHRLPGPDRAVQRTAAGKHRDSHAGVFLMVIPASHQ